WRQGRRLDQGSVLRQVAHAHRGRRPTIHVKDRDDEDVVSRFDAKIRGCRRFHAILSSSARRNKCLPLNPRWTKFSSTVTFPIWQYRRTDEPGLYDTLSLDILTTSD